MRTAILISGKQNAGKTSFAQQLLPMLPGFMLSPLDRPLKNRYCAMNGLAESALYEDKYGHVEALASLAANIRETDPDYFVKLASGIPADMIVDDWRFVNELEFFQTNTEVVYTVRVNASQDVRESRGDLFASEAVGETELDNYGQFDFVFTNEGDNLFALNPLAKQVAENTLDKMIEKLARAKALV
jgi:phosphomevalonate kinase